MKPEGWLKIEQLYHSALKREKKLRAAFIQRACVGDESLRREVESLLAHNKEKDSFLKRPVLQAAARALAKTAQPLPGGSDTESMTAAQAAANQFRGTPRFELRRCLGQGGFGVVHEVFDRERNAIVALKVLHRSGADALHRFKSEFRALADIAHPNLVALYELFAEGEHWFFTMELVKGINFLDYLAHARHGISTSLTPYIERLEDAFGQLTEGILALHHAGKLHCDLKPSNVLVERTGRVVILDFGLVAENDVHASTDKRLLVGTPEYLSPEQIRGEVPSSASDWYSVGIMLHQALTGKRPSIKKLQVMAQHKTGRSPAVVLDLFGAAPRRLIDLCQQLLSRDPHLRPRGGEILRRLSGDRSPMHSLRPPSASRGAFIGREHQLSTLRQAFDATRSGRTITIWIHGPSGVGKTALVKHFLDEVRRGDEVVVFEGRCYEREVVPYKALDSLIDGIGRYLQHMPQPETTAFLPRDFEALARLFPVLQECRARTCLTGCAEEVPDPKALRARAVAALRQILDKIAQRKPVILVIDDLQWGDEDSADLLTDLIRSDGVAPVLMVICYRTEEAESSPVLRRLLPFARLDALSTVDIGVPELEPAQAAELASVLIEEATPPSIAPPESIAREAQGNPYFIGELVRYALSLGEKTPSRMHVPSLQAVMEARLSRLPGQARRLLEVISVAGQPLDVQIARRAARVRGGGYAELHRLRAAHMVRTRRTGETEQIEPYHDRIREVIEAGLGKKVLKQHHYRLATEWEASAYAPARILATHFHQAGVADKAFYYAAEAANQAEAALAFGTAREFYGYALEALPNALPESPERDSRELTLRRSFFLMTHFTKGIGAPESAQAVERGAVLAEKTGNPEPQAFWILMRGNIALNLGDLAAAATLADRGLELALQIRSPTNLALAYSLQMATCHFRGDLAGLEQHFTAGFTLFNDPGVRQLLSGAMTFAYACWNAWMMGRPELARQRLDQIILGENEGNQYNLALSEAFAAISWGALREFQQCETVALRALERAEKYHLAYPAASARCSLGFALAHLGRPIEGVALLHKGMAAIKEVGGRRSDFRCHLAQAQLCADSIDDALATIQEVLRDSPYDIEALRVRGKLLQRQRQLELAEADFGKAIVVARHIGAKGLELRAATDLAAMLAQLGRCHEARTRLAEIYGSFTEGFETADLKDAKALLDELRGQNGGEKVTS